MIPGPDFQLLIVTVISEASCGPPRRPTGRPFIDYRRNSGLFAEIATPCHTARLSFRVGLPGLIFDLWAVPSKTGRALGCQAVLARGTSHQPRGVIPLGFRKTQSFPERTPPSVTWDAVTEGGFRRAQERPCTRQQGARAPEHQGEPCPFSEPCAGPSVQAAGRSQRGGRGRLGPLTGWPLGEGWSWCSFVFTWCLKIDT